MISAYKEIVLNPLFRHLVETAARQDAERRDDEMRREMEERLGVLITQRYAVDSRGYTLLVKSRHAPERIYAFRDLGQPGERPWLEWIDFFRDTLHEMAADVRERERRFFHFRHANRPGVLNDARAIAAMNVARRKSHA